MISFPYNYWQKKKIIKTFLADVDTKTSNKMSVECCGKLPLFEDDDDDQEINFNFNVEQIVPDPESQKLLELIQVTKDDRFQFAEEFLENNDATAKRHKSQTNVDENEDISLREEKNKEFEILSQIIGRKIGPKTADANKNRSIKASLIRYDPTVESHARFELKQEKPEKKRKKNKEVPEIVKENTWCAPNDDEKPVVSKEVFYKVSDTLKESLKDEKAGFSLLNMFGSAVENYEESEVKMKEGVSKEAPKKNQRKMFMIEENPFKYDSSDDEDQTADVSRPESFPIANGQSNASKGNLFIGDQLFFSDDDYRLQEGLDFVRRLGSKDSSDFLNIRKEIKTIIKMKQKKKTG